MERVELERRYAAGERDFRGFDLRGTDLRGLDLRGADLRAADLRGARFSFLTLDGKECFDDTTLWPKDRWLYEGTTIDGDRFLEVFALLLAIGPDPSTEELAMWRALADLVADRDAATVAALNGVPV